MSILLQRLLKLSPEGDNAPAAAPASPPAGVDWGSMSDGVSPGSDDNEEEDSSTAPAEGDASSLTPPQGEGADEGEQPNDPTQGKQADVLDPDAPVDEEGLEGEEPVEGEEEDLLGIDPAQQVQLTPEQLETQRQQFAQWEATQIATLEKHYQFNEDDASALQTEPEVALPKMAAKLHMSVLKAATAAIGQMLPQMMQAQQGSQAVEARAQKAFFDANPDLKKVPINRVVEVGKMFRAANPDAKAEELIKGVGEILRAGLGKKVVGAASTPAAKTNVRAGATRPKPHTPARAGGVAAPAPKVTKNPWAELVDED